MTGVQTCALPISEGLPGAPRFRLDGKVTDFYDFTPDSVALEDYQAHPLDQKIPVAV